MPKYQPGVSSEDGLEWHDRDVPGGELQEGDVLKLDIVAEGDEGDGIGKLSNGFTIIVPGAHRGERCSVSITDVEETYAKGEVIRRL